METATSPRRVQRVRHELRRRELQVRRVEPLGPGFVAVTLGGAELEGFVSLSFDDHLKLFVPGPDGTPVRRDYTPRRFDAARQELTLELALHGHGPASDWARRVRPGDPATIAGPRGSMIIPTDFDWLLLAGDASALPAIHRRLDELPRGTAVQVMVLLDDAADIRPIERTAGLALRWLHTPEAWLGALHDWAPPAGDGFVWCAGEARLMHQARELLRTRHGLPGAAMRVAAYWKRGAAEFHETLDDDVVAAR
jgi:NADPH-dependent ferric siderophore reductase